MDIGCKLWGVGLSSLDVTPEDTEQFFQFKHAVLKRILFWRNPLTRLKTCLVIYVAAHLPVCAYYRLRSQWRKKLTCFLGYVTTVAWRVKTQHFTKPNHTLGKHCDITENTAALTCFGLCEYGGPRGSKDITENIFQKTTVYKTKQKTKISEKIQHDFGKHNFLLTVVVVWHVFCEVFWPSGPPYLPRQHHSNISGPVFFTVVCEQPDD